MKDILRTKGLSKRKGCMSNIKCTLFPRLHPTNRPIANRSIVADLICIQLSANAKPIHSLERYKNLCTTVYMVNRVLAPA